MNFKTSYRIVMARLLGLDRIRIEVVHKYEKTEIRPDPLPALLMGVGRGLTQAVIEEAQKDRERQPQRGASPYRGGRL